MDGVTRWASNGEVSIAFRVLGDQPTHLLFVGGLISHIDVILEEPGLRRFFERLTENATVILIDRRGSGMSDRPTEPWKLDDEIEDLAAVLDAVGCDRAVIMAYAAGGPVAIDFAAQHPERSLALALYAPILAATRDDQVHWANSPEERNERLAEMTAAWGTGANLDVLAPSVANDERMRAWLGRLERQSMTPGGLALIQRTLAAVDVRDACTRIRVPTLILHREHDQLIDVRHSRMAAQLIPGARYVELPGQDSLPMVGDMETILGELEEFLTGSRRSGGGMKRALLTVAFTDIVDATGHAARMGDARWRDLLSAHDATVRRELQRFGGTEIKTVGDAFLAVFDGAPSEALRCAREIVESVRALGVEIRVGLHTGECEVIGDDVGGMAVHIAARVAALAQPCEVLTSGTVYGTVVGAGLDFEYRGDHELRGVPGKWPLFALS